MAFRKVGNGLLSLSLLLAIYSSIIFLFLFFLPFLLYIYISFQSADALRYVQHFFTFLVTFHALRGCLLITIFAYNTSSRSC